MSSGSGHGSVANNSLDSKGRKSSKFLKSSFGSSNANPKSTDDGIESTGKKSSRDPNIFKSWGNSESDN